MAVENVFTFDVDNKSSPEEGTPLQLSPHLQNTVRRAVLTKRQARGEEDIKIEFTEPTKYELTEDEKEKKERRKKQNREAARRCRLKKKNQNGPKQMLDGLVRNNDQLKKEVLGLQTEVAQLQTTLRDHQVSGHCVYVTHSQCSPACLVVQTTESNAVNGHFVKQNGQLIGSRTYTSQTMVQEDHQFPAPSYSPVSSCGSPYTDQQALGDCGQWQLPDENTENITQYITSSSVPGTDPVAYTPPSWTMYSTQSPMISGTDRWLNQDQDTNRDTPEMLPDDNASLYPTSFPSANVKPGPEVTTDGDIGIPSLDAIQLQQLVTTNLILPDNLMNTSQF